MVAEPTFPSPVAAAQGVVAWASGSGSGHRFEIVVSGAHVHRALTATSAAGWIDGVSLGTDSAGHTIVVYSHCPSQPLATRPSGHAGTDGCRLWWAPVGGSGAAHEIGAAPPDPDIGDAVRGTVTFAVQHRRLHRRREARDRVADRGAVQALTVPSPEGATINEISAGAAGVAFAELPAQSVSGNGVSEIWLDTSGSAPRLIAKLAYKSITDAETARYFDGLTLPTGSIDAFLVAQRDIYPPTASELERISLPSLATTAVTWIPGSLSRYGVQDAAFDPGHDRLALSFFSQSVNFEQTSATCSQEVGNVDACPVTDQTVSFGATGQTGTTTATGPTGATAAG